MKKQVCEKHHCELKPLFTSLYCPRCKDEEDLNKEIEESITKALWEFETLDLVTRPYKAKP